MRFEECPCEEIVGIVICGDFVGGELVEEVDD